MNSCPTAVIDPSWWHDFPSRMVLFQTFSFSSTLVSFRVQSVKALAFLDGAMATWLQNLFVNF